MKSTDNLFLLIKSLNKNEKRYFKLFASLQSPAKNYILLFNAIEKQTRLRKGQGEYDENKIKKTFAKQRFIRRLSSEKVYLYNLIMKSLRNYHNELSISSQLKYLLKDIEILYEKSLFKQCEKIIAKAKRIANTHEKYLQLLEVLDWEKKLSDEKSDLKNTDKINSETQSSVEKINNIYAYRKAAEEIIKLYKHKSQVRTKEELKKIDRIIETPLLGNINNALSHDAKLKFYTIHYFYCAITGDVLNQRIHAQKMVDMVELHRKNHNDIFYIGRLNNLINSQLDIRQYEDAMRTLNKLKAIDTTSLNSKVIQLERSYNIESDIYISTGKFEKVFDLAPEIETGLKQYASKFDKEVLIALYYNLAYLYFGSRKYSDAILWLNKLLNSKEAELRNDILAFTRILNLIVHYELGNTDVLPYILKSTYRFLQTRNQLYKAESSILNFIRKKIPKIKSQNELIDEFKKLKIEIKEITKDPFERKVLEYFDFISWLESKIENRPFAEIVKEKVS